jgi:hypothetical protein
VLFPWRVIRGDPVRSVSEHRPQERRGPIPKGTLETVRTFGAAEPRRAQKSAHWFEDLGSLRAVGNWALLGGSVDLSRLGFQVVGAVGGRRVEAGAS